MPRIGVVLDAFDASYQSQIVKHLSQACRARRLELSVFPCGILGATEFCAPERNALYRLISARGPADALVLLGSTIVRQRDEVQRWCERVRPLPLCSIGLELEGVPSILPDNRSGIRALVRHLVSAHGAKRLAFVAGPAENQESCERLEAFRAELAAHGLDPAAAPCVHGDFLPQSGREAARQFLAAPEHELDAIVSANDYMAMGVLEVLASRGSSRERRIAVTGFDDVAEAAFTMPPLTTVEQPLQRLAEAALSCLLAQLEGNSSEAPARVDTRLSLRRSCGCNEPTPALALRARAGATEPFEELSRQRMPQLTAELERASEGLFVGMPGWDRELVSSFFEQLRGVPGELFLSSVDRMLQALQEKRSEVWRFHGVLSVLRASMLEALSGDPKKSLPVADLLQAARLMTSAAAMRAQAREHAQIEEVQRVLNRLGALLSACSDLPSLRATLDQSLPSFGISRAYLFTVVAETPEGSQELRLCHALGADGARSGSTCAGHELLPESASEPLGRSGGGSHWVVLPLFSRRTVLGYAVLELRGHDGAEYETLRIHLSAALASSLRAAPEPCPAAPVTRRSKR